jgi:hypothetical protein
VSKISVIVIDTIVVIIGIIRGLFLKLMLFLEKIVLNIINYDNSEDHDDLYFMLCTI